MRKVRGALLTLRCMGFYVLVREILRRLFGITYRYCGILIDSGATFRAARCLASKGYDIYGSGDEICVRTLFGEFCVNIADVDLLAVLFEPLEEMYGFVNVRDAVVIDTGAYIGETALLFLSKGASRVYALEPVDRHYKYLLENILRNDAADRVVPLKCGAWFREATLNLGYAGTATGLSVVTKNASVTIEVRRLGDILKDIHAREGRIDLVKMDCEGCEYSLLSLPHDDIKLVRQWIIEIHGSEAPIIDKMAECGYSYRRVRSINDFVSVYYFTHERGSGVGGRMDVDPPSLSKALTTETL